MSETTLTSASNLMALLGITELSIDDAMAIIQNISKVPVSFPNEDGDSDDDNGLVNSAETYSASKLAYFEDNFNVSWVPTWDDKCSEETTQLINAIEEKESKIRGASSARGHLQPLSDDLKRVVASMIVFLKCSMDSQGFKDSSDWDLINKVGVCCHTLLKVCSMKSSYSHGFINNNIIAMGITVSQSICTKLIASKEALMIEYDPDEECIAYSTMSQSSGSTMAVEESEEIKDEGNNSYSSRLRVRSTRTVYFEGNHSTRARCLARRPCAAANLIAILSESSSLLDYVTSRNVEHITDIYLELLFSAIFALDHKSEEFCMDKDTLTAVNKSFISSLMKCALSGEQIVMRFMRLAIFVMTFSVRDCSIFPKDDKLKIALQKVVCDKIMHAFIEKLAISSHQHVDLSSKKKSTAGKQANSNAGASNKTSKRRQSIVPDCISDRSLMSTIVLGMLQRLLLSLNGELKTSMRALIQSCLCGLVNRVGDLLVSRNSDKEDRALWDQMISRFIRFVFKASKSMSHHLRYAATDISALILHSCDWAWLSSGNMTDDLNDDWIIDSDNQGGDAINRTKLVLVTLVLRMNDNNASVRLKALNAIGDLFQSIVTYIENHQHNLGHMLNFDGSAIVTSQLAANDILFLIRSQYLLRLCLGVNVSLINASVSSDEPNSHCQRLSLMDSLRSRAADLKSLIVAKSIYCYFHALSIKWIRLGHSSMKTLFTLWARSFTGDSEGEPNINSQVQTEDMTSRRSSRSFKASAVLDSDSVMMDTTVSVAEEIGFDYIPLLICEDDITLVSNYCSYSNSINLTNSPTSITVRKQSISSLTEVLKTRMDNRLVAGAWVTSVMVAIADLENSVVDKAVVSIHDVLVFNISSCRARFERMLNNKGSGLKPSYVVDQMKQFQMVLNVCEFILASDKNELLQKCMRVIMQSGRVSGIPGYTLPSSIQSLTTGGIPAVEYYQLMDSVRFMCAFGQFTDRFKGEPAYDTELVKWLESIQSSVVNAGWLMMESLMLGQFRDCSKLGYNLVSSTASCKMDLSTNRFRKGKEVPTDSSISEESPDCNDLTFILSSLLASKSPQLSQAKLVLSSLPDKKLMNCIKSSTNQQLLANLASLFTSSFKEVFNSALQDDFILTSNDIRMIKIIEALLLNSINYQQLVNSTSSSSVRFFDDILFVSVYVESLLLKGVNLSYPALSSALQLRLAISKIFASIASDATLESRFKSASSKEAEIVLLKSYLSFLQWDLARWVAPLMSISHYVLYYRAFRIARASYLNPYSSVQGSGTHCNLTEEEVEVLAKSVMQQYPIVELCNRYLFTIGEISIIGFMSEEVESKVIALDLNGSLSISNCTINSDSNRIYVKVVIPESIVSIVQLFLGTSLPKPNIQAATSSEPTVNTSDVFGSEFDVNKIAPLSSQQSLNERSNRLTRCFAFVALGKLCIRSQSLARSSLNLYRRELSLNSGDSQSEDRLLYNDAAAIQARDNNRSNTLLVLGDLCVRHTNLIERHINQISLCLQPFFYEIETSSSIKGSKDTSFPQTPRKIFNSILVRKHAFIVITQLLQQDYVKCSGELLLRLAATASNDPDEEMVEFAKLILKRTLLLRNPDALLSHVSEAVVFFNSCTSFSAFNYRTNGSGNINSAMNTDDSAPSFTQSSQATELDLLSQINNDKSDFKFHSENGGAILSGIANRDKRLKCYAFMLEDLTDEQKIQVTAKIVNDILSASIDTIQSPNHIASSSNADYISNFNSAIEDTFLILQSPLLKVGRKSQAQAQEDLEIDPDGGVGLSQISASQSTSAADSKMNNAKLKLLKVVSKKHMISEIVPVIFSLKHILQKSKSPLQGWLMGYLMFLTKSHKAEMDEVLASDPIMKAEIEYEMRHYDEINDISQNQSIALEDKTYRRTSLDRAKHVAKVVSDVERVHYSAMKEPLRLSVGSGSKGILRTSGSRDSSSPLKQPQRNRSSHGGAEVPASDSASLSSTSSRRESGKVRFAAIPSDDLSGSGGAELGSRKSHISKTIESASSSSCEVDTLADRFTSTESDFDKGKRESSDKRSSSSRSIDENDNIMTSNCNDVPVKASKRDRKVKSTSVLSK